MSTENLLKMVNDTNKFRLITERLKKRLLLRTDKELAEKIGLKPKAFHARKQSGSIPYSEIIELSNRYKLDLNWVLNDDSCSEIDKSIENFAPQTTSKKEKVIVVKHQDLLSRFKNPEKGIENNAHLRTIEDASEKLYKKVSDYLKTTSEAAIIIKSEMEEQKKRRETDWKESDGENASSA